MAIINIVSAALDADTRKVKLLLTTPVVKGDVITITYTKGTITSVDGKILDTFTDKNVINKVESGDIPPIIDNQIWAAFKPSPVLTSQYPYQTIVRLSSDHKDYLICSKYKLYDQPDGYITNIRSQLIIYILIDGEWNICNSSATQQQFTTFNEANQNVYTDSNLNVIRFTKTT